MGLSTISSENRFHFSQRGPFGSPIMPWTTAGFGAAFHGALDASSQMSKITTSRRLTADKI
jgi:hypothetical protein